VAQARILNSSALLTHSPKGSFIRPRIVYAFTHEASMKASFFLIIVVFASSVMLYSGCGAKNQTHLMNETEFSRLSGIAFPAKDFRHSGNGVSQGGERIEFSTELEPVDPSKPLNLDLSEFGKFLESRDKFNGSGTGGSHGLYWRTTWDNSKRYITIDASYLKNGTVRLVYREMLR
jgi:hypothetical protein